MNKKYFIQKVEQGQWAPKLTVYTKDDAARDHVYVRDNAGNTWGDYLAAVLKIAVTSTVARLFNSDSSDLMPSEVTSESDYTSYALELIQRKFSPRGKVLTNSQVLHIYQILLDAGKSVADFEVLAELMGIMLDIPFVAGKYTNPKNPQEYFSFICPTAVFDKIPFIGAVYFNTGASWQIFDDPVDLDDPADRLADKTYTTEYTELTADDDLRNWAAQIKRCSPADVMILR